MLPVVITRIEVCYLWLVLGKKCVTCGWYWDRDVLPVVGNRIRCVTCGR